MKFPNLPAASALTGAEVVPVTQGGIDKRTTTQAIANTADPFEIAFAHSGFTATNVGDAIVEAAGLGGGYTIVTEASAFTADPGTHDGMFTYNRCGGDVTFDNAEPYTAGMVFNIRATAAIELIEDGVTLTPPAGGTLELDADMAVQVVMTGATTGDVIGQTVAA